MRASVRTQALSCVSQKKCARIDVLLGASKCTLSPTHCVRIQTNIREGGRLLKRRRWVFDIGVPQSNNTALHFIRNAIQKSRSAINVAATPFTSSFTHSYHLVRPYIPCDLNALRYHTLSIQNTPNQSSGETNAGRFPELHRAIALRSAKTIAQPVQVGRTEVRHSCQTASGSGA